MGKFKPGIKLDRAFALGAFVLDLIIVFVSLFFSSMLRFGNLSALRDGSLLGTWAFYSLFFVLISEMEGLYFVRTTVSRATLGYRAIRASLTVTALYTISEFLLRLPSSYFVHSRFVIIISLFSLIVFYFLIRVIAFPYIFRSLYKPFNRSKVKVLVFGDDEFFKSLQALCRKSLVYRSQLELVHVKEEVEGNLEERVSYLIQKANDYGAKDICICDDKAMFGDFARLAWMLHKAGMFVSQFSGIFENLGYFDTWLKTRARVAMTFFSGEMSRFTWLVWRVFEIIVTSVALLLLLPLLLLVALMIKLDSRGPVLFIQDRVGFDMKRFAFPKFRSMTYDPKGEHAKAHREYFSKYANGEAADSESNNGFKLKDDSRITMVGKVLRWTSIDELPQLWCVLTGKMSLVGPRPCIPYELEHYNEWEKLRFTVKPGLTGIWQVYGRSRLPMDAAQFMDFCYVINRSIDLNVRLILKTVPIMLIGKGGV